MLFFLSPSSYFSPDFTIAYSAVVDVKDILTQHTHRHGQKSADRKRRERKSSILIQEEVEKVRGLKMQTHKGRKKSERDSR